MRKAVQAWEAENPERRPRRRPKASTEKSPKALDRVAPAPEGGIEIEMDY
jgi:hypothetical protein